MSFSAPVGQGHHLHGHLVKVVTLVSNDKKETIVVDGTIIADSHLLQEMIGNIVAFLTQMRIQMCFG